MSDPFSLEDLPPGKKHAPNALDDVPADWADMEALGTPYIPVLVAHPDYADVPIIRWRLSTGTGALASGYGNNYGNDYGGPA